MELFLYNHLLPFDEYYLSGAKIYFIIHNEAEKCSSHMMEIYSKISTLNDIAEFSQQYKTKIYNNALHSIILLVNSHFNNSNIVEASIFHDFELNSSNFESTFSRILNKYLENINENAIENIYKSLKKSAFQSNTNKSDLIKYSIQKIIDSNTTNLTMHEVNLILNSLDYPHSSMEITPQMKVLLNETPNIDAIKKSIYKDIQDALYPIIAILEANNAFRMTYPENNFLKAQKIISQLEDHNYDDSTIITDVIELISLSPYDPRSYAIPYYLLGDDNNDLESLCQRLHVDINFKHLKDGELNAKKFLREDFSSIEKVLKSNFFYKQTRDLLGNPLSNLIHECKSLFNSNLQQKILTCLEKNTNKFNELINLYGCFDISEENPLLIFDINLANNIEDGFIITDKRIYFFSGSILELSDLTEVKFIEKGFLIGDLTLQSDYKYFDNNDINEFTKFVEFLGLIYYYYASHLNVCDDTVAYHNETMITMLKNSDYTEYAQRLMRFFYDRQLNDCVKAYSEESFIKRKFYNAIETYAPLEDGEIPLLCFDNTAFGSSKDGLMVTNFGIHLHNSFSKQQKLLYSDIKFIRIKNTSNFELIINDTIIQTTMLTTEVAKTRFCLILNRITKDFLLFKNCKIINPNEIINNPHSLQELLTKISDLCSSNIIIGKNVFIFSNKPKILKKFENALLTYAKLEDNEIPYLCFDDTVFGSAREGCIITNVGIYIHNAFSQTEKLRYSEITQISLLGPTSRDLFINNLELFTSTLTTYESKSLFCRILNLFFNYFRTH